MQKIESLNNITHEKLRVNASFSTELGDNLASTITFFTELREIEKEYPILCRKDPETGEHQAVVFFGLQKDENLFLTEADPAQQRHVGWRAEYVPAAVARGPFSIGVQREADSGSEQREPVVHIDLKHPKACCDEGEALFLENGGRSPYLNYITTILDTINDGMHLTKIMFEAFNKHELLEPVTLDIQLVNQDKLKFNGFETINVEKLSQLSGEELEKLNKSGFLQAAYFLANSMSNFEKLIDWKNRKLLASGHTN
ncbi:SapC family protein [Marinimicrobium sp. ARAG 43.8]|uniref:SapC family protein n=1 Tax=Marinimicrobium sp. ARAG 43.8 TaxID=3418719 RepID=UPI003CEC46CA